MTTAPAHAAGPQPGRHPMNPAEELRTASARLRELAERATHEDRPHWNTGRTLGSRSPVVVDHAETPSVLIETYAARLEAANRYIAAMDPALGMALADWLEWQAAALSEGGIAIPDAAITVARAINGEAP